MPTRIIKQLIPSIYKRHKYNLDLPLEFSNSIYNSYELISLVTILPCKMITHKDRILWKAFELPYDTSYILEGPSGDKSLPWRKEFTFKCENSFVNFGQLSYVTLPCSNSVSIQVIIKSCTDRSSFSIYHSDGNRALPCIADDGTLLLSINTNSLFVVSTYERIYLHVQGNICATIIISSSDLSPEIPFSSGIICLTHKCEEKVPVYSICELEDGIYMNFPIVNFQRKSYNIHKYIYDNSIELPCVKLTDKILNKYSGDLINVNNSAWSSTTMCDVKIRCVEDVNLNYWGLLTEADKMTIDVEVIVEGPLQWRLSLLHYLSPGRYAIHKDRSGQLCVKHMSTNVNSVKFIMSKTTNHIVIKCDADGLLGGMFIVNYS